MYAAPVASDTSQTSHLHITPYGSSGMDWADCRPRAKRELQCPTPGEGTAIAVNPNHQLVGM